MATFRNAYSKPVRVSHETVGPSMAQQCFKRECDVNVILARFRQTGLIDHVNNFRERYEDVSLAVDYQTALHITMAAGDAFLELPSPIRKRFDNDPSKFMQFMEDPANIDEIVSLGLAVRKAPQQEPIAPESVGTDE